MEATVMKLSKEEVDQLYVCASIFCLKGDLMGMDSRKEGSARMLAGKIADFLKYHYGPIEIVKEVTDGT